MRRGEVWWVSFDPSVGGEIRKRRPAIIVSNDASNLHMNRLQVVPLTSKTDRLYPGEAYITLNGELRKAIADQITTVSKRRVSERIGVISPTDMDLVEYAIKMQLALR